MVRKKTQHNHPPNTFSKPVIKKKTYQTLVLVDKKRKRIHGTRVLQEIKHLQKNTNLLIPRAPFARIVREIIFDLFPRFPFQRIQASALEALQESAEMYIIQFFEDAVLLSLHTKRVTLMRQDMILLRRLRGRNDIINK